MQIYRCALLRFTTGGAAVFEQDALLALSPLEGAGPLHVVAAGAWSALASAYQGFPVTHWPNRIIAPGFIDMHVHFPQTDVIGSPAEGLLPWLENYTFPHES
ncbi:MAG: guanine deaminase, partial [Alcaligenaceae bacterium]